MTRALCNTLTDTNLLVYQGVKVRKGKSVPLQARRDPQGSRKLRFPGFTSTAKVGGGLTVLRTGRLYPQEMLLLLISESTPGP